MFWAVPVRQCFAAPSFHLLLLTLACLCLTGGQALGEQVAAGLADLEAEGKLAVHGAWFDISTGELWVMDAESGDFVRPEI